MEADHEDLSSLISNLRDANATQLLNALAELKSRVQAADLHNAGNHVTSVLSGAARDLKVNMRSGSMRSASMRSASLRNASFRSASMLRAPSLMRSASKAQRGVDAELMRTLSRVSGSSTSGGFTTNSFLDGVPHGMRPPASHKIDDAKLPIPPRIQHAQHIGARHDMEGEGGRHPSIHHLADFALSPPEGSHEWDSLQTAVAESCAYFSTPSAIVAWKKWCLNKKNVSLVVSLFWFVVSEVFLPTHPLTERGALKEHAIAHFSRQYILSVIQFKGGLKKDLYNDLWQKVLASAVILLLKDCYPRSDHKFNDELRDFILGFIRRLVSGTLPADSHPTLHSHPGQSLPAAISRQQQMDVHESNDFIIPPPPPPILDCDDEDQEGSEDNEDLFKTKSKKGSPSKTTVEEKEAKGFTSGHLLGFSTTKPSPVMEREMKAHGLGELRSGDAAIKGRRTDKVGGRSQPSLRRPLDAGEGDEVSMVSLARQCTHSASEAVKHYEERRKELAHEVTRSKMELIEFKRGLDQKVAEIQNNSAIGDDYIPGPDSPAPVTARTLANHLSSYLENDVQRLARRGGWEAANSQSLQSSAFPTPSSPSRPVPSKKGKAFPPLPSQGMEPSPSSFSPLGNQHLHPHLPTYLASTEAIPGALHGSSASDLIMASNNGGTSTRIMASWSRMRRCEEALSGALSQAKKNSSDVAARVFGSKKEVQAERRPARGTADIKVQREARMILSGLDLERYR